MSDVPQKPRDDEQAVEQAGERPRPPADRSTPVSKDDDMRRADIANGEKPDE